jgi:hypothetical protein
MTTFPNLHITKLNSTHLRTFIPDAATGNVFGHITDLTTGDDLADVIVQIDGVEEATTTDESGDYFFDEVSPGTHNITCILDNYQTLKLGAVTVKAGEETEANGVMEKVEVVI